MNTTKPAITATSASSSHRSFFLLRWKKCMRYVLAIIILINGILFFHIHTLTITYDHANNDKNNNDNPSKITVPSPRTENQKPSSKTTQQIQSVQEQQQQQVTPWNNSLFEGSNHIKRYLLENNKNNSIKNLWEYSTVVPSWMKEYFYWHQQQRQFLLKHPNSNEWKSIRYYLLECSSDFTNACGGTADRLGPLPFHILMASRTKRLLLIYWTKPAPLETFLLPPVGGLDWRLPSWLQKEWFGNNHHSDNNMVSQTMVVNQEQIIQLGKDSSIILLRVKFQSHNHGRDYYDEQQQLQQQEQQQQNRQPIMDSNDGNDKNNKLPTFAQVYHDLWRICFTPAPAVATKIEKQMDLLGLQPGKYIAVHVRAYYKVESRDDNIVIFWTRNSLRCAMSKFPIFAPTNTITTSLDASNNEEERIVMPFLFVSDSSFATQVASEFGNEYGIRVVHRDHDGHLPLHLEKATTDQSFVPEDFYDTFVDLYMIGMSTCTTYNMGGFGRWGSMIGYNSSCSVFLTANMERCENSGEERRFDASKYIQPKLSTPLFLSPMPEEQIESQDFEQLLVPNTAKFSSIVRPSWNSTGSLSSYNLTEVMQRDPLLYAPFDMEATKAGANTFLWHGSRHIPAWMKKYFRWHHQQRASVLNPQNWTSMRLLVMECLDWQDHCGGTSDRLKPLPTMIRFAAATNRFLLIHWTRPAKLEEFLLPPKGGVDWRVPDWLHPLIMDGETGTLIDQIAEMTKSENMTARTRFQSYDGGSGWYDEHLHEGELAFNTLFHDVWRVFFTPAPPVALRIKEFMDQNGLAPEKYASAHIRALYAVEHRSAGQTKAWTRNGVNCATGFRPGRPVFVASDSKLSSQYAIEYGISQNGKVVTHQNDPDPPLHLDAAEKIRNSTNGENIVWGKYPPAAYYDTFIDVYLLALAKCVFISKGGFGHWALLIGGNVTCTIRQKRSTKGIQNPCNWTNAPDGINEFVSPLTKPLFLEPVEYSDNPETIISSTEKSPTKQIPVLLNPQVTVTTNNDPNKQPMIPASVSKWNTSDTLVSFNLTRVMQNDPMLYAPRGNITDDDGIFLWDESPIIPEWMKKYFQWHHEQRKTFLKRKKWRSMKLFVMECLEFQDRCGGTSDRLKPLPTLLRMAAMTNRFILIHWRRPAKLEEFLLPPKGGIDWRVPDWLHPLIMGGETGTLTDQISIMAKSENVTVRTRFQSFDGGCGWYDDRLGTDETSFNEIFHEVWRIFFTPAPPVALRIKEFMDQNGLAPEKYASAHIRALYAIEYRSAGQTKAWTRNAVNCASRFRPGKPVFVASDSKLSSQYAIEYGISQNGKVVTHPNDPDPPLHLDKADLVTNATDGSNVIVKKYPPAAYYDTFIDVYLLALAKCVFISKGGFGHWALLIGGNVTCTIRQKRSTKGIQNPCNWTNAPDGINEFMSPLTEPLFLEPMDYM